MNNLSTYLTTKITALSALIGAVVGVAVGYQQLLDLQPFFALKQAVIDNERRAAFNRINDLNFQILYFQASAGDSPEQADLLRRKTEERDYLECSFQYRICAH